MLKSHPAVFTAGFFVQIQIGPVATKRKIVRKLLPGRYYPLGATLTPKGVNFAIFSQFAQEVTLLLFDDAEGDPVDIIKLEHRSRFIWHTFVSGLKEGQLYAYKVQGEYNASSGKRFNHHKLLLDPYAKAITGKVENKDGLLFGYQPDEGDWSFDTRDSTRIMPKCIVVNDQFDWEGDSSPDIPMEQLVIYETHIKGFTAHPSSKVKSPGTYLGFIEKIPHLQKLGINAVEFLPIHEFYVEDQLREKGLTNYWGYNPICYFAPESSYSTMNYHGCQVREFKELVRALHKAGIEVILDVVYNHTGEGNENGPTINLKGIDNSTYYMVSGNNQDPYRFYVNHSGCGNTLNIGNRPVLQMVMDSLRYWAEVMHVDGFRFDLASVLGRENGAFQKSASFFDAISQDPILNKVKLIAEPWDIGTYQVGNFPVDWSEWNGKFRDTVRRFWRGEENQLSDLGKRLTGSADLYAEDGRSAYNSINFITAHDGFTMYDIVSYSAKHNEENLDENRDGTNENYSQNCGIEGDTDRVDILTLRKRMTKNFITTLVFSSGTPMFLGGDEFMRTQKGNNNAYCQDNEISWYDWNLLKQNSDMVEFFCKIVRFAKSHSILQHRKFFSGEKSTANGYRDITWFGFDLEPVFWDDPNKKGVTYMLNGGLDSSIEKPYFLYVILNADENGSGVHLPILRGKMRWYRVIDTSKPSGEDFLEEGEEMLVDPPGLYYVNGRTAVVLIGKE